MNEDWTKDIQRLMADRKVKAPDGLLEEVKQRLASTSPVAPGEPIQPARKVAMWRYRWLTAAAVVAAIAVPVTWRLLKVDESPRVVVNEALMFLREKKKMLFVDSERDIPDAPDEPPDTSGLTADMVDEALRQLPDGYRAVFNLYAIEGKSHKEIAELLGIKPDTSASQYHRAKAMLARLLSKRKKETQ